VPILFSVRDVAQTAVSREPLLGEELKALLANSPIRYARSLFRVSAFDARPCGRVLNADGFPSSVVIPSSPCQRSRNRKALPPCGPYPLYVASYHRVSVSPLKSLFKKRAQGNSCFTDPITSSTAVWRRFIFSLAPSAPEEPMVEAIGFEPTTPWLQTRCSPAELRPQLIRRG
jgi:hypothetical protein